jgi:N-acetylmuramoyl-L-alanine amidase
MCTQCSLRLLCVGAILLLIGCAPEIGATPVKPSASPTTPTYSQTIGLLAGHQGAGSGATCSDGVKEVAITIDIAARLQKKLRDARYQIDLLDEFDARLDNYHAAVFVALHADSCIRGASGFKIAGREMNDPAATRALRDCLQGHYREATHLEPQPFGVTPAMTHYYAFDRLAPETPAAIIELGFISTDRAILLDQPDQAVQGVYDGIVCFLEWKKHSSAQLIEEHRR